VNLRQISKYYDAGHFAAGSMGPKIEAAMNFLNGGGKKVIITSIEKGYDAVKGKAGTSIVP
jgi:carbamate kinase